MAYWLEAKKLICLCSFLRCSTALPLCPWGKLINWYLYPSVSQGVSCHFPTQCLVPPTVMPYLMAHVHPVYPCQTLLAVVPTPSDPSFTSMLYFFLVWLFPILHFSLTVLMMTWGQDHHRSWTQPGAIENNCYKGKSFILRVYISLCFILLYLANLFQCYVENLVSARRCERKRRV